MPPTAQNSTVFHSAAGYGALNAATLVRIQPSEPNLVERYRALLAEMDGLISRNRETMRVLRLRLANVETLADELLPFAETSGPQDADSRLGRESASS